VADQRPVNSGDTAERAHQRKGCIETLMEQGLSKEEATKRCGGLKPIDLTPRKGPVHVDINERKHYLPKIV